MNDRRQERAFVAEIDFGRQADAIVWAGQRPLHHFWPLLSPYFRDVLLTPQRRSAEDRVAWHWQEHSEAPPPRPSELAGLRKRLAADQQSFADNLGRDAPGTDAASGLRAHANVGQLGSTMETTIARLTALPDAALARYVCRTDTGLRLHSWSATVAASPHCPDEEPTSCAADHLTTGADRASAPAPPKRRRPLAALLVLAVTLAAGSWAWSRRSRQNHDDNIESPRNTISPRAVAADAARRRPVIAVHHSVSHAAEAIRSLAAAGTKPPSTSVDSEQPLDSSQLAREIVVPANTASLPVVAAGAPISVGAIAMTSGAAAIPGSSPAPSSSANTGAQSDAATGEPAAGSTEAERAANSDQPPTRVTPANLRRAIAAPPDADEVRTKKSSLAAAASAELPRDSQPDAAHDNDDPADPRLAVADEPAAPATQGKPAVSTADAAWHQTIRVQISPWRGRLLDDTILPTLPRPRGANENLSALRGRLLRAKAAALPASFRQPAIYTGIIFALPSGEIVSTDLDPSSGSTSTLRTRAGVPYAEISSETEAELTLRVASEISVRLWLRIEPAPDDAPMRDGSSRFQWQASDGANPARHEIRLSPASAARQVQFATVRDRVTGWALTAEIRVQTETTAR